MKQIKLLSFCLAAVLLASCNEKPLDEPEQENVTFTNIDAQALSINIKCSFDQLSEKDVLYGTFVTLYCESDPESASMFESWKNGNDNPGCQKFTAGKIKSGGGYEANISGLTPGTGYDFCVGFISEDGSHREISKIQQFKTKDFAPVFENATVNPRYFSADLSCNLAGFGVADMAYCTFGYVIGKDHNPTAQNGTEFKVEMKDSTMTAKVTGLAPETTYYYRSFVKVNATDDICYGQEQTFQTSNLDGLKLDLGLPSGTIWASSNLGADTPFEFGDYYFWATTKPINGPSTTSDLWYYDPETGSYQNVGDIAGTEHDAAHMQMGGKWRMPRKEELEELFGNCTIVDHMVNGEYVSELKSKNNGNSMIIPFAGFTYSTGEKRYYWDKEEEMGAYYSSNRKYNTYSLWLMLPSSTQCDANGEKTDESTYYISAYQDCYMDFEYHEHDYWYSYIDGKDIKVDMYGVYVFYPYYATPIRPVWDPNL